VVDDPGLILKHLMRGGVFFGVLAGVLVGLFLYARLIFKKDFGKYIDIAFTALPLGHAIARIGCFLAGCCWGKPTSLPWGVKFPNLGSHVHPYHDVAVHPTQLYEMILNLANFLILLRLLKRKRFDGQIFAQYLINYGIIRFIMEYLRGDVNYVFKGGSAITSLTTYQLLSFALIAAGLLIYKIKGKPAKK
jgi:phosphatidylglycerol:prolipoprotein diacylglycerol transferase